MKPIDFDAKFREYLREWVEANLTGRETEEEAAEKEYEAYEAWLNAGQDWLGGKSPGAYFDDIAEADKLARLLAEYVLSGVPVPEPLELRLIGKKEEVYPLFLYMLEAMNEGDPHALEHLKIKIMALLGEMELPHPYPLYIRWVEQTDGDSELAEEAAALLSEAGPEEKDALIRAYHRVQSPYAADCLIDILSNYPGDPYIVELISDRFANTPDKKAFYANCLGKLGDPDALTCLYEALEDRRLGYYDYTAVQYAIEELGGAAGAERDFTGDADYEKLEKPD